jgi:hypothetical protein
VSGLHRTGKYNVVDDGTIQFVFNDNATGVADETNYYKFLDDTTMTMQGIVLGFMPMPSGRYRKIG